MVQLVLEPEGINEAGSSSMKTAKPVTSSYSFNHYHKDEDWLLW